MEREDEIRRGAGEVVALKVKIPELGEAGDVGGEGAGEVVEAEAERAEGGQVGERAVGERAEERSGGEAEDGDAVVFAENAGPVAWRRECGVPEECAASDGGAKGQQGRSVGGEI